MKRTPEMKLLSIALTLIMVFVSYFAMPAKAIANEIENAALTDAIEAYADATDFSQDNALAYSPLIGEWMEGRNESTKVFHRADGAQEAVVYRDPVHYLNGEVWETIDNTLELVTPENGTEVYRNKANDFVVSFSPVFNTDNLITVEYQGHILSWRFAEEVLFVKEKEAEEPEAAVAEEPAEAIEEAEPEEELPEEISEEEQPEAAEPSEEPDLAVAEETEAAEEPVEQKYETLKITDAKAEVAAREKIEPETDEDRDMQMRFPEELTSEIAYQDAETGLNVHYVLSNKRLSEQIVLDRIPESAIAYTVLLTTNGLKAEEKNGRIVFIDEAREVIFEIMPPVMYDAIGEESTDIEVQLIETENGYAYTLIPSEKWLTDETRAYPVTIDPDIKLTKTASEAEMKDAYVDSDSPSSNFGSSNVIWVSNANEERKIYSLVKPNVLPALKSGDIILESGIYYARYASSTSSTIVVSGYRITESWDESTVTYNSLPSYGSDPVTFAATSEQNRYSEFDVTSTVKSWYEDPSSNYGILLKGNSYAKFISANANAFLPPYLSVIYRNSTGLESNWTYYSQNAGRAGTGSVNLASGNLTWTLPDSEITNGVLPISLSHVYNVNDIGSDLGYGFGWRLNYTQTITRFPVANGNEPTLYYEYTDGDGTRHYYKEQNNEFVNELDKDSKLSFSDNDTIATIKDKGDNKLVFQIFTSGSGDDLEQNGRLIRIEDANGNKTHITYNNPTGWSLRISKITEQLSGQSEGQELTLEYNSLDLLKKITAPNGLNIEFSYSSANDLTGAQYADGNAVSYTYSSHCMTRATNIDGYNLRYEYNDKKAVCMVQEYAGNTAGQYLALSYGRSKTVVTDTQNRKIIYMQDALGQPISVMDPEGRTMFAAYNTGEQTVTQLSAVSKLQNTVINLLKNHGFERSSTALTNWTPSNTGKIKVDTAVRKDGSRCVKFLNAAAELTLSQTVPVETGKTYTFSAWFKGAGQGQVQAVTGTDTFTGDPVSVNDQDWTRATVTFTATADTAAVQLIVPANNGIVYADSVQLEESSTPNRYNMVENCNFRDGITGWESRNYTAYNGIGSLADAAYAPYTNNHPASLGNNVYCFNHTVHAGQLTDEYVSQSIPVVGQAGDTYSFGGWMRSTCPAKSEQWINSHNTAVGVKSITVEFLASNGSVTASSTVELASDANEWQYICGVAVATHSYRTVRIKVNATRCIGTTLCDGLQLYRETFSQAYTYDARGNLTGYTTLIGQQNSFEYDDHDNVKSSTDPRGNKTTYTYYDNTHNVKTAKTAEGVKSTYTYDGDRGQVTKTVLSHDGYDKTIESETAYNNSTGLVSTSTDARGNTVTYGYDSSTRQNTTVTDPLNHTATYVYGSAAAMHRLASITSTGLGAVVYGYDTCGVLETITRGTTVYRLTYDVWNRPLETKVGTTALSTNTYDSYGKLLTVSYANGFAARYEYDNLDRVRKIYQTENNTESLVYEMIYNGEGDLYELRNYRTLRASFFDYDHAGRCMASKERSFTVTNGVISYGSTELSAYGYQYDECNNLTKLTCSVLGSSWSTVYTYDGDNRASTTTLSSGKVLSNTFDALGRLQKRTLKQGNTTIHETAIGYLDVDTNKTTGLVSTYRNGSDDAYTYTYDAVGNITAITQGSTSITYEYDEANRLTRENNGVTNQTVTYEYDTWGNILNKKIYAYTTADDLTALTYTPVPYAYTNTDWGDQLTSYDGQTITYDNMGNPTSYRGYTFGWRGKQLTSASNGTNSLTFEYNEDGLRQKKTVNNVDTDYFYNGSVLIGMQQGTDKLLFSYDASGSVVSVDFNGTEYYYLRNAQGDIVKLIDASGATVVEYTYDTWGKKVTTTGTLAGTLGLFQPFRYRGYVYDEETGFYYLQSRYYDPTTGRFISADVLLSTGQGVLGHNCYAYCLGNPVGMVDDGGTAANRNNTVIMADGRSGKMIKRVTPVYDPPIRISYFSEGQEQEAINSYRRGNITLYKGALLVPLLFFPSSYAFGGMIHLKDDDSLNITTLKHESGHISQERILGPKKYVASIGIPSLIGYALDYFGIIPPNVYFNLPWERGADLRSNVHRTTHVRGSDTFATIYELLSILMP